MVLPRGIRNFGNSCYLNASLQQLYRYPEFRKHLDGLKVKKVVESSEEYSNAARYNTILENLRAIFAYLENGTDEGNLETNVNAIRQVLFPVEEGRQQDAQEFITQFFACLEFNSGLTVLRDGEPFPLESLQLTIKGETPNVQSIVDSVIPLIDAGESMPSVLMFALSRESLASGARVVETTRDKTAVELSDEITIDGVRYTLVGIVRHSGASLRAGRYVPYVYDREQGVWFRLNDGEAMRFDSLEAVMRQEKDEGYSTTLKQDAYILRYERVDGHSST